MKNLIHIITLSLLSVVTITTNAELIQLMPPEFITNPLRNGVPLIPDSLTVNNEAEIIEFPDLSCMVNLGNFNLPNVKKILLKNIDFIPSEAFCNLPSLEEIHVKGLVGHFDCDIAVNCPNLKFIKFYEPVGSTGGPNLYRDCEKLDSVSFDKGIINSYLAENPKIKITQILNDEDYKKLADFFDPILRTKDNYPFNVIAYNALEKFLNKITDSLTIKRLTESMEYMLANCQQCKSKLEILKESPEYTQDSTLKEIFIYANSTDIDLTETRKRFNLDSIAGNDDDISRIKNLLYWVHNNIRHDGNYGLPDGPITLTNIYDSVNSNHTGVNCRGLAIALTEALLAEGIPARYLTCEPRDYETDTECHVICVAWSESLNKWIWVDPTMASYVTDENGLLLHPGEVRYRLINDLPLILNEDANWNNETPQTKEYYLEEYMAKNLYFISSNMINKYAPEGPGATSLNRFAVLIPKGAKHPKYFVTTSDDVWFWQAPK